jgi:probable HAF family extracellular repeat protein
MGVTQFCHWRQLELPTRIFPFFALVLLLPGWADAQYTFRDLDVHFQDRRDALYGCVATGINDAGLIVGACNDANRNDTSRGFLYDGRRFADVYFPTVKGESPVASYQDAPFRRMPRVTRVSGLLPHDVNSALEVTGWYQQFGLQGFLKRHGLVSNINVPDSLLTEALGINDAGHVVGDYRSADGVFHGFLLANGVFTTFGNDLGADDINNAGQIVGCYASCSRGFLYNGSTYTSIDVPGATVTQARGLNDTGQIVGVYFDGATLRGFVYDGTGFEAIEAPGAYSTEVNGINNEGVIVGSYVIALPSGGFEHRAFVATLGE